ncbi:MAG: tRNA (adenosine(37)-N6)-dimethylallyltransferase MiaA [Actinophytocola sp.]|uniref:tRNA (adenosine(37)-N6)-dimethylallyltransferase MiaA n=1 Tax=Actinophytocola sp. TaxID=1872138 RepID=UPI0013259BAE|nr:tRNA (adenosine(37)-N6)-dimethylallyltransferase MiaA [Actinophytocola sp.]MPZ82805.1 tRNA (adenosine(37)-N6)-dimethylallyltransferase MiaA [Actinophytocola sp.]
MRPIAIVGPTATGKSQLGIALAEALGGEVVNTDAIQLYRGMDIGTAKVTEAERRGVPHHLLDVLDVTETASVAAYQRDARAVVERLLAADTVPILVGGSGLYVRAVLDDLEFPGTDPEIRTRLEGELARVGAEVLHARLTSQDPIAATAILPTNGRRVVRALEVIELTGRPFSATMPRPGPARYDTVQLGLDTDTDELDRRVDTRVAGMFDAGLVEEVRTLLPQGLRDGRTASRALGYRQVIDALDNGADHAGDHADHAADMAVAAAATAQLTRRFVRRQRSWFRRDQRVHWLDATRPDLVEAAAALA